MPIYEYFCPKCQREVTIPMSIHEHEEKSARCPKCGARNLTPLVSSFFSTTSRKS